MKTVKVTQEMDNVDTIYALSSGALPSGVAVVRISGPHSRLALEILGGKVPQVRQASLQRLSDADGKLIDEALVLFFAGPSSFTGEDVVELHCHGGQALIRYLLTELSKVDNLRPAEMGEFSKRAFFSGRMDLLQAEGLSDLIHAETETQRQLATFQIGRGSENQYSIWRKDLIRLRSILEAELDFPDEDDVPAEYSESANSQIRELTAALETALVQFSQAEIIRDGFKVALIGQPNTGKSSLLNQLVNRDFAIVTNKPGTTRDVLEVKCEIEGLLIRFFDTAGLRDTEDEVEKIGVQRAYDQIDMCDLILHVVDGPEALERPDSENPLLSFGSKPRISVATKEDLLDGGCDRKSLRARFDVLISNVTRTGFDELLAKICHQAQSCVSGIETMLVLRERHKTAVSNTLEHLYRSLNHSLPVEMRAEELRLATDHLGRVVGFVDSDEVLDLVFSTFCIGK